MRRLAPAFAYLLLLTAPLQASDPVQAIEVAVPDVLVERAGLDQVFARFGEVLAGSARQHGVTDARFLAAWEAASREAFGRGGLDLRLSAGLATALSGKAISMVNGFLASALGTRIAELEAAVQGRPRAEQIAIVAKGGALMLAAGSARRAKIQELFRLSNADMMFAVLGESLRGIALGLHLAQNGDIAVPWEEIDAVVGDELRGLEATLRDASIGVMAYTFATLTDYELETYLDFLRAPETQTYHTVSALIVSTAIHEAMAALSKDVVRRLSAASI